MRLEEEVDSDPIFLHPYFSPSLIQTKRLCKSIKVARTMPRPTEKTVKKLFALSGNRCAFPGCPQQIVSQVRTVLGEICHIRSERPGGPRYDPEQTDKQRHGYENLILLCRPHHKIIDDQVNTYSGPVLTEMKQAHEAKHARPEIPSDALAALLLLNNTGNVSVKKNSGNVAINSPGAILAREVHIRARSRKVSISPPPGSIGADLRRAAHVQHLINRYNEFASREPDRKTKFSYGAVSKNIEHRFGAPWRLVPVDRFDELRSYLEGRIRNTRIGRQNLSRGYPLFTPFEEE